MLSKRAFGVISLAVQMANPNGEIETGLPRLIPSTGCGWISPYRIKRELRGQMEDHSSPSTKEIFKELKISEKDQQNYNVFESRLKGYTGKNDKEAKKLAVALFADDGLKGLARYWDLRCHGTTMLESESEKNADDATRYTRTGAVQFAPFVSLRPVNVITAGLSKLAPLDDKHLTGGDAEGTGTFGNGAIKLVEHGVYYGFYSVSANESDKTKMTDTDLEILKKLIPAIYSRHSAQQVGVHVLQAFHFTHNNVRGSFNEFSVMEFCKPKIIGERTAPSTSIEDYHFMTPEAVTKFLGKKGSLEVLSNIQLAELSETM